MRGEVVNLLSKPSLYSSRPSGVFLRKKINGEFRVVCAALPYLQLDTDTGLHHHCLEDDPER